ncbi:MAG: pantoate--beta-alanine ligase [Ignavibacteriae bacterium]|nr:pantoate--beta-alanine ligase [Ignavibacteriota bacterium]
MKIIEAIHEMHHAAEDLRQQGKRIAVVPTMGYLHDGHLSLIRVAKQHADVVITTIFVNPTQFGPNEDFTKYPRDLDRDKKLAASVESDILFVPSAEAMYPELYRTYVIVEQLSEVLEGKSRPSHFRGVTTVVTKLFNITRPHVAVFGQKDAQQAIVINQMVKDLNVDIEIIVVPIVREHDGLAMSSRNLYLSATERMQSTVLFRSLQLAEELIDRGERQSSGIISEMTKLITSQPSARIDYISLTEPATLQEVSTLCSGKTVLISLAVWIGTTRLIDNILKVIP